MILLYNWEFIKTTLEAFEYFMTSYYQTRDISDYKIAMQDHQILRRYIYQIWEAENHINTKEYLLADRIICNFINRKLKALKEIYGD